ncbi:MAG TPA: OmpA family protein [Chitinophagaceae bacterium]|jgi:outer membrane protein OmpA-like peptidoglycan-associated protein|nr:OmpA family protein [Chitinophagaceae bacterium]HMU56838.1 OmpA family protein [Chitinophagaceae bacterium]
MKTLRSVLMLIAALFVSAGISAQIDVLKKIKNKANQRIERKVDKTIDQGLDSIENAAKKNPAETEPQDKPADNKDNQQTNIPDTTAPQGQEQVSLQTYSKYDFMPGEKVVFYDDFSQDAVGDFPALWNTNGSGEVVNTNLFPGNWLKYVMNQSIWTDKLLILPDNYTLEFDVIAIAGDEGGMGGWSFRLMKCINEKSWDGGAVPGKAGFHFGVEYFGRPFYRAYNNNLDGVFWDQKGNNDDEKIYQRKDNKYHISVWVQKTRVRVYQNENKIFDVPRALPDATLKMDRLRFEANAAMISNIRIAVGAPDMRNKLMTEGKIVSYGIYFDVNKDVVKPQSYASLKEIAKILTDNPDVKINIVGHTDADGSDASNLDLSKRRAASVKKELVKTFGIDAARMETDGKGETQPVATNDTPSNKALNRRVEFIKL